MQTIRILLCCGVGMSSGFLASSARKSAKKRKIQVAVEARSISELGEYLRNIDVLLLGPHYEMELPIYQEKCSHFNVPVGVIPQDIYGSLDGERLLDLALSLTKK